MLKLNTQLFATPVQPTTGNTHISTSFGKLLEPGLRRIFFETYKSIPEQYSRIYNVLSSSKAVEHEWGMGAFGDWTKRATELSEVTYSKLSPGLERTYTHTAYTHGFMIGRELYDDDQYNQIEKFPKALARGARHHIERDALKPLINGFSADVGGSGVSAIYDGKALFATDHPLLDSSKTGSNLVTGALNKANLEKALMAIRSTVDEAGNLIMMTPKRLIVPPALEYIAKTLMQTQKVPGSNNNDINTMYGELEVVVLDYLGSTNNGSDTAWFVQCAEHEMNFFWRMKPEFKWDEDFDTFVAKYRGYMRYSYGVSDWRGMVGSKGL